ncbi:AAA family ATPase [Mycolicibacterium peregrinum]|uniref:nucleotide-binding protein n=1 Tax=Mycolicibacterium peregrinum TaxID=43304 RepID=UPI000DA1E8EE|nr:AAA family ATPase [Mycolicibacterium peregrinum]
MELRNSRLRAEQAPAPSDDVDDSGTPAPSRARHTRIDDEPHHIDQKPSNADSGSDIGSPWFDEIARKYRDAPYPDEIVRVGDTSTGRAAHGSDAEVESSGPPIDAVGFEFERTEEPPAEEIEDLPVHDEPLPDAMPEPVAFEVTDEPATPETFDDAPLTEDTNASVGDTTFAAPEPEPTFETPSTPPELDDIEVRADRLLARRQPPAEPTEDPIAEETADELQAPPARDEPLPDTTPEPVDFEITEEPDSPETFDDAPLTEDIAPSTTPEPEPTPEPASKTPETARELDTIEARAARLLAQMEARRSQSAPAEPEPTAEPEEIEPVREPVGDTAPEVAPVGPFDAADQRDGTDADVDVDVDVETSDRSIVEDDSDIEQAAAIDAPQPTDLPDEELAPVEVSDSETSPATPEDVAPPAPSEPELEPGDYDGPVEPDQYRPAGPAELPARQRSDKRMALPPWQVPSPAMSREFDPTLDATGRQVVRPVDPKATEPAGPPPSPPAPPNEVEPPAAQSQPPQPPPGFQGPPPGWGPLPPPPPPPGWGNPPPWANMPPLPPPGWLPPPPLPRPQGQPGQEVPSAPPPPPPPPPPRHAEQARHAAPPPPQAEQPRHAQPEGWVPPPSASPPPPNYQQPQAFRVPPSLDEAEVFNRGRHAPQSGWRRTVHKATGGRVNPGDSRKNREMEELLAQIRQPIVGDFRIAVLSIKGGVGKTTTTLGLGSALAMVRTDRVIALDANPDRGTLAERVRDFSTRSTVRDLLRDPNIRRYADVRAHTRMASSRLEVLASEQDPAVAEVFGETDYRHTMDILRHYYNIILTDCGTGIMHSAMAGVLDLAHAIVLVSSPAIDAARSASATLDWLMQHGHAGLVREAHVVLSASRPGSAALKLDKVYEHFEARCRSIHLIPFDEHLAEGADIDFGLLKPATMQAYIELAGAVSEKFARLRASYDGR